MIKRSFMNICIALVFLAVILTGSVFAVSASDDEDKSAKPQSVDYTAGGGYAASNQIPGAYFLPVIYDASNGLPTSEANCILCASDGYIWIGGYSGIVKYDGINFERLPVTDGLTSGRGLFEDSIGRIWVATNDSGVVIIDGQERIHFTKNDGLSSNSIRTFAEDNSGNVFIGSTAGVSYIDKDMKLHRINDSKIDNSRILRLVSDSKGKIYGHTGSGEVFTVSTDGIQEYYKSSDLGMDKITTILADPSNDGWLYFGTNNSRIYYGKFGSKTDSMKKIDTGEADNIHWMHFACDRLWVSSVHIAGYVDENDKFIPFESVPMKDSFEMMTSDYQGNMWFASSRYGVMKFATDAFLDITSAAGFEPVVVNATCKRGDDLYIGTDDGLRIIDKDYHSKINSISQYFVENRIRCIMNDSNGNTWFSTFSDNLGLVSVDPDGNICNYTTEDGLLSNEIRCTYEMTDGTIVVGTSGGLSLIRNGKLVKNYGAEEGFKNTVILSLCEGYDGEIYAGTDGDGIYVVKEDTIEKIGIENGLGSDVIMRIKKDEIRDVIWIITSCSVDYINRNRIIPVTTFPYNNNFDVILSGDDSLAFLSSRGIYIVEAESAINDSITSYKLYDKYNGLTNMPVSQSYSGIDEDGELYVAGQTGVSVININDIYDNTGETLADIRSVFCDGKEILPDSEGIYNLPTGGGRVQINPAILDYSLKNPLIRVYLEGVEDGGITANQNALLPLEYTDLKYGDYILHIQILDSITKDIVSDDTFLLSKKPGFFERISVRILIVILAIAAFGIIVWRIMTNTFIRKQYAQLQDARDEAERANFAKNTFLTNMSHEIRTPINTIIGMDEMILRKETENVPKDYYQPVMSYAHNIKYASENLLNLVNDLLEISKIESGEVHLVEQEYDTEELLRGIVYQIRGRAEKKKLSFNIDIDETIPKRLYGDSVKIKQIILNLLLNAVKFTDEGGIGLSVKVTDITEASVILIVTVKDTGIGVKKEELESIFSGYENMDEISKPGIHGNGLGLEISKHFADLMEGKLWCESIYGEGSDFFFVVNQKIVDIKEIGHFLEDNSEEAKGGYVPQFIAPDAEILVVDDDPMNLSVFKELLKPTKVFVTTAKSGEECLAKLENSDIDVVFLDHMMPGMDGIETLQKIRENYPELPVYALSANSTAEDEAFYRAKGFNGFLTKPIDSISVEHVIMRHIPENKQLRPD